MSSDARSNRIRDLNDQFRKSGAGVTIMNPAILENGDVGLEAKIRAAVREYDDFSQDYIGEHDAGIVIVEKRQVHWYIKYQSTNDFEDASPDPADPRQTFRVLCIGCGPGSD